MAHVKRNDLEQGDSFIHPDPVNRFDAGGHVAQLQADLAHRLIDCGVVQGAALVVSPGERMVRFVSIAGGGIALLTGYAVAAVAIARWI